MDLTHEVVLLAQTRQEILCQVAQTHEEILWLLAQTNKIILYPLAQTVNKILDNYVVGTVYANETREKIVIIVIRMFLTYFTYYKFTYYI